MAGDAVAVLQVVAAQLAVQVEGFLLGGVVWPLDRSCAVCRSVEYFDGPYLRTMYISCFHGRANITLLWLTHMESLGQLHRVAAAVTEGDRANIELLDRFGVRYCETPNQPLGGKHNAALELAGDAPRYMVLPSDDFISREWVDVFDRTVLDYVSPDRCGVVDMATGRAKVLVNKPNGRRKFGAGRIISRKVVHACGGKLWTHDRASGLDTDSHGRIVMAGFESVVHRCDKIPITDLKTSENIWGFDVWTGDAIDASEALHMVSDWRQMISS